MQFQRFSSFIPINYALGFVVCLVLEGPLALSSKVILHHYDQKKHRRELRGGTSRNASEKQYEMTSHMSIVSSNIDDHSLFRRLSRLPKLRPHKSLDDHEIARVE